MFKECILHIGSPRTGTTTLQFFLGANRKKLADQGFVVPASLGRISHRPLAIAAYGEDRDKPNDRALLRKYKAASTEGMARHRQSLGEVLANTARTHAGKTLVLTSEHCYSLRPESEIKRVKSMLDPIARSVRVIVYFRPQHEFIKSLYSMRIQNGKYEPMPKLSNVPDYFNYYQKTIDWANVFGQERIIPRLMTRDDLINGDLCADFLAQIGAQDEGLDRPERANSTLSGEMQAYLLELGPHVKRAWGPLKRMVEGLGERPGLVQTREQVQAYKDLFAASNEALRALWFPHKTVLFDIDPTAFPETAEPPVISREEAFVLTGQLLEKAAAEIKALRQSAGHSEWDGGPND